MEKQQRIFYLDNVCGVLILFMIFVYHQRGFLRYSNIFLDYVYATLSFFMFWFFFKGGMMFKDRNVADMLRTSARRLLLPYFVFLVIGILCEAYLNYLHEMPLSFSEFLKTRLWEIVNKSTVEAVGPCWFLIALFVVRIVFQICITHRIPPVMIAVVSLVFAYLVYYCSGKYDYSYLLQWGGHNWSLHIPYWVGSMSLGLMCYSLGYVLKDKQYQKWVLLVSMCFFVARFVYIADIQFVTNNTYGYNYLLAVLYGVTGCVVINNVFKWIANVKIPVLTNIGKNSMIYYLVHWPVMYFITQRFYGSVYSLAPEVRFVTLSCILAIVLWLSGILFRNKHLGFLFGM